MSVLCSVSERIHRYPPKEQHKFSFALLKTLINLINFNNSSMSHYAKVKLHDLMDLHVKMAFYGVKTHCWERGRNGAKYFFYLDYCIFIILGG